MMFMDRESESPNTLTTSTRHKCSACFKQYKKKEHLIEHMKTSYHSIHQPKCGVCQKHCKSFESLREHLTGPLPNSNCRRIFLEQGCDLCLKVFDSPGSLNEHKVTCCLTAPSPLGTMTMPATESQIDISNSINGNHAGKVPEAVALDCEMVGGGSDGSLNLCARVCLIDEDENLIFHTYVQPQIPVTHYRYEITGIMEAHLRDAMPLKEVQDKILKILYNGESIGKLRLDGGKARLLVGHGLEHDLDCMRMNYPDHLRRDTAKYRPLMKTNLVSHSLKYLTQQYLGYEIHSGVHDPYEDCVSVMRLYKKMRVQEHEVEESGSSASNYHIQSFVSVFDSWRPRELENMTPDELYRISRSNYRCWCLDSSLSFQKNLNAWGVW